MIRIGIGSWTLPWAVGFRMNPYKYPRMSPLDLIAFAQDRDIHLVQLYNNIDLLDLATSDLMQIKKAADEANIELEIGGERVEKDYVQKLLNIAEKLDSRTVRIVIPPIDKIGGLMDPDKVIDQINGNVGDFEHANRTLLIENHDRYTSREYLEIIDSIGSSAIGICFDSANSLGKLEHFRDSFKLLKDHIKSCHYKEYSIQRIESKLGFIIQGCKPGKGENISEELFGLLNSLEVDIDVVLEQWVPFQGSVEESLRVEKEWAEEGIKILRSLSLA